MVEFTGTDFCTNCRNEREYKVLKEKEESGKYEATISAIDVLPVPAGPYKIIEKNLLSSNSLLITPFWPTKWSWPMISSNLVGLNL